MPMPIEIREVVIKAKLEKNFLSQSQEGGMSEEKIQQIKAEILEDLLEKMEEKFWRLLNR